MEAAAGGIYVVPVGAQIAAIVKLGTDFGWTWKVVVPLGSALVYTVVSVGWALAVVPATPDRLRD